MTRRRSRKRTGKRHLAGWILVEALAIVAFVVLWTTAEQHRNADQRRVEHFLQAPSVHVYQSLTRRKP